MSDWYETNDEIMEPERFDDGLTFPIDTPDVSRRFSHTVMLLKD